MWRDNGGTGDGEAGAGSANHTHWSNRLFVAYGVLCTFVFGLLLGELTFGSISLLGFVGVGLATAMSFLAGAGTKGSLLIGTASQMVAGVLLGIVLVAVSIWIVHSSAVVIVIIKGFGIPGELWIAASALTGFLGANKLDTIQQ